jgi:hypothetical protein
MEFIIKPNFEETPSAKGRVWNASAAKKSVGIHDI